MVPGLCLHATPEPHKSLFIAICYPSFSAPDSVGLVGLAPEKRWNIKEILFLVRVVFGRGQFGQLRLLGLRFNGLCDGREYWLLRHHLDRLRSVLSNLDTELTDKREKLAEAGANVLFHAVVETAEIVGRITSIS